MGQFGKFPQAAAAAKEGSLPAMTESIENKSGIVIDVVPLQECNELLFERDFLMVLLLVMNVGDDFSAMGIAYRKSRIARLPRK